MGILEGIIGKTKSIIGSGLLGRKDKIMQMTIKNMLIIHIYIYI